MLKAVIIEDEVQNLERLNNLLLLHCPDIEVVGSADGVKQAFKLINDIEPELVFLDIQLTDGTGFDLLNLFDELTFKVIFVTAFESYAIKAFRLSALDYLLKPVDQDELIAAVEKARQQEDPELKIQLNNASNTLISNDVEKLVLRDLDNIYVIELKDISHCEAEGNYTRFHFNTNQPILISKPMKDYESLLKDSGFMRIHRSYLVNLKHIKRFEKSDGGSVYLSDTTNIPVASSRKEELISFLEQFKG